MRSLSVVKVTVLLLGVAASAMASIITGFTNPTTVNLLETWNPNGTYGLATSTSGTIGPGSGPSGAEIFVRHVGWYFGTGAGTLTGRYYFKQPVVLGQVMAQFRSGHVPNTYSFSDQNGVILADTPATPADVPVYTAVAARSASTYLEFTGTTTGGTWDMDRIGAYLAPSQPLLFDGTYNIFYEEVEGVNMTQTGGSSLWTNHLADIAGGAAPPGLTTYALSQSYPFVGAMITHEENRTTGGFKIEVSQDGLGWTTAYGPTDITGTYIYMPFSQTIAGQYVRFSYTSGGGGGGQEFTEFQLFAIPEPASLALLVLGGLALLRPRRR